MYFPRPLVLASGCFKSLLFTALSSDNIPAAITFATVDVGIRGAYLATYVGLGRYGLQLPVGQFLPPPTPVTDTDLALYVTPVVAAAWGPSVNTVDTAIKSVTKAASTLITVESSLVDHIIDGLVRPYRRCAKLPADSQPVLSFMGLEEDSSHHSYHNGSCCLYSNPQSPSLSPLVADATLSPNFFASPAPSSLVESRRSQVPLLPAMPGFAASRSLRSAVVVLGQCTPYRVLPPRGRVVLATDIEEEPNTGMIDYKSILDDIILDELEEPKEATKMFVEYKSPPCTEDTCALTIYVEPSRATHGSIFDCWVLLWYCHVGTSCFFVACVCSLVYRMVRWTSRLLHSALVCSIGLIKRTLRALARTLLVICDWVLAPFFVGVQAAIVAIKYPSNPSPNPIPATPIIPEPNPTSASATSFDATAHPVGSQPATGKNKKRRGKKKKAAEKREGVADHPASIPLLEVGDPVPELEPKVPPTTPTPPPMPSEKAHEHPPTVDSAIILLPLDDESAAPPPPPTPAPVSTPALDPTTIPLPEDEDELDIGPSTVLSPASGSPGTAPIEGDEGGWETVVKRKPWRPFVAAPSTSVKMKPMDPLGVKIGRGRRKGKKRA